MKNPGLLLVAILFLAGCEKEKITICHNDSKSVRIEISDTGIGIDPEDQEAIFERFFRVENRVHTLEGTGLGLSIVRNIIEKHHSQVHLVSEVGVGTTFWFDLDVFQDKRTSGSQTPDVDTSLSTETLSATASAL